MNKFFKNVLVAIATLVAVTSVSAQEAMKEFLLAGEYTVAITMKSSGRVFNGSLVTIKGSESDSFLGSTYQSFTNAACSRNVVLTQKMSSENLSLILTRPTLKDCDTNEWVFKKTSEGYSAELFTVVDGSQAGPSYATAVIKKK